MIQGIRSCRFSKIRYNLQRSALLESDFRCCIYSTSIILADNISCVNTAIPLRCTTVCTGGGAAAAATYYTLLHMLPRKRLQLLLLDYAPALCVLLQIITSISLTAVFSAIAHISVCYSRFLSHTPPVLVGLSTMLMAAPFSML